MTVYIRR